ncbi:MAG TPA: VWA domain-containing protein [Candidatus Cloacimonadota bacterium]|nr:VWA domain-containing protein [Candidatus Cloacimonadota bacterium]
MNIYNPQALILLVLIPVFIILIASHGKRVRRRFSAWAEEAFRDIYLSQRSPFYSGLKLVLILLAMVFIILALARPQWDYKQKELESEGIDIVFAIDISRSMAADDIPPNRLLRSVLQISAFIDQLKGDRLGIISFAGAATIECPITDDYEAVKLVLGGLSVESAVKPGTDIGRALDLAKTAFKGGAGTGALILVSDGEDLEKSAIAKARELGTSGIRVYTMGVGSPEGALITNPHTGEDRLSKLDEDTLKKIASVSGGEYYRVTPSAGEIQLLLNRMYQTETSRNTMRKVNFYQEQYHYFAALALILLLLESLIRPRKRTKPKAVGANK